MTNRMVLTGVVCRTPVRKVSPSGIPHCQLLVEHRSLQQEAGLSRQAWCKMPVAISGQHYQALTHRITIGTQLKIAGFVSCHKGRNGLNKLVLHAEQIDLIDSGD